MRKGFGLTLSVVFLLTGVMIIVTVGSLESWYTGAIYIFLGGLFLKNSLFPKEGQDVSGLGVFKADIFITNPFRAAISYFLLYYGAMSLFLDFRELSGSGETGPGIFYLISLLMVLFTYVDQLKKSKLKKKNGA